MSSQSATDRARPGRAVAAVDGERCPSGRAWRNPASSRHRHEFPTTITIRDAGHLDYLIQHAVESPRVQHYPFQLDRVVNQYFEIHHYQPLLFVVDSCEHLFGEVNRLAEWTLEGRVSNVSTGDPEINEGDLKAQLRKHGRTI